MNRSHLFYILLALSPLFPAQGGEKKPYNPPIAGASDDGLRTLKRMTLPPGLKADLYAA